MLKRQWGLWWPLGGSTELEMPHYLLLRLYLWTDQSQPPGDIEIGHTFSYLDPNGNWPARIYKIFHLGNAIPVKENISSSEIPMDKLLVFKIAHPCQILFKEMSMPKICQMSAKNLIKYVSKMPSNIRQWNHFNIFLTKPAAISLHHCSSWMKVGTVLFPGQVFHQLFPGKQVFSSTFPGQVFLKKATEQAQKAHGI